jgi:hypothetical protein
VILKKNAQQKSRVAAGALDYGKKGKVERLKEEAEVCIHICTYIYRCI